MGGLALRSLKISEGRSNLRISFGAPNPERMKLFALESGGSNMVLSGLANANFVEMTLKAGAGDHTLSFDGKLAERCRVLVEAGVGSLTIRVPVGTNAEVNIQDGLTKVNPGEDWKKTSSGYTQGGKGPVISIEIQMGLGTLNLQTE